MAGITLPSGATRRLVDESVTNPQFFNLVDHRKGLPTRFLNDLKVSAKARHGCGGFL